MDLFRQMFFKWLTALLYFGLIFAPLILFPLWLSLVLLGAYVAYAAWLVLTLDWRVSRDLDLRPLTRWDVADYDNFRTWLKEASDYAGLRREPHYAVLDDEIPNAMAFGGVRGIVVFTTGLLRLLSAEELAAVAGHELQHLRSRDALPAIVGGAWLQILGQLAELFRGVAYGMSGFFAFIPVLLAAFVDLLLWVVSGLGYMVMAQRSRFAEQQADLAGARLTSAAVMASALGKLERKSEEYVRKSRHPKWSAAWITERLHASHPATDLRVQALQAAVERGEIDAA